MVEAIAERYGAAPARVLVDTKYATQAISSALSERPDGAVCSYTPPPADRDTATAESKRKRVMAPPGTSRRLQEWRARMASDDGRTGMRRAATSKRFNGNLKNREPRPPQCRGLIKAQCLALLHAFGPQPVARYVLRQAAA